MFQLSGIRCKTPEPLKAMSAVSFLPPPDQRAAIAMRDLRWGSVFGKVGLLLGFRVGGLKFMGVGLRV